MGKRSSERLQRILAYLAQHDGVTTAALAHELDMPNIMVSRACEYLYRTGRVGKELRHGRVGRGHPLYCVWRQQGGTGQ